MRHFWYGYMGYPPRYQYQDPIPTLRYPRLPVPPYADTVELSRAWQYENLKWRHPNFEGFRFYPYRSARNAGYPYYGLFSPAYWRYRAANLPNIYW